MFTVYKNFDCIQGSLKYKINLSIKLTLKENKSDRETFIKNANVTSKVLRNRIVHDGEKRMFICSLVAKKNSIGRIGWCTLYKKRICNFFKMKYCQWFTSSCILNTEDVRYWKRVHLRENRYSRISLITGYKLHRLIILQRGRQSRRKDQK